MKRRTARTLLKRYSQPFPETDKGNDKIQVWTDGSCYGERNGGPGGWAALIRSRGIDEVITGGDVRTTSARMELIAVCEALERIELWSRKTMLKQIPLPTVIVTTDWAEIVFAGRGKLDAWAANNWCSWFTEEEVKNRDLWERIREQTAIQKIHWRWVPRHSGCECNIRVDQLAREAAEPYLMQWNEEVFADGKTRETADASRR